MQGRTAIGKILKMEGVEFISGFPMNPVIEGCAEEGIRTIMARNERVSLINQNMRFLNPNSLRVFTAITGVASVNRKSRCEWISILSSTFSPKIMCLFIFRITAFW